jgi:hypothetical protein
MRELVQRSQEYHINRLAQQRPRLQIHVAQRLYQERPLLSLGLSSGSGTCDPVMGMPMPGLVP